MNNQVCARYKAAKNKMAAMGCKTIIIVIIIIKNKNKIRFWIDHFEMVTL